MKILILGGTGAMGAYLTKTLALRGDKVVVTSRSERKSEPENVQYVRGNAHDAAFLKLLLRERFDAIVDFMIYNTEEFKTRRDELLEATDQYLFLSSSRVYADSTSPITENSPRLLDSTADNEYLKTDEYALAKARQENLLFESGRRNWTIVRPYITYSSQRLQLGAYEKELWLFRALNGRTILFPKEIAEKYTTMTYGEDVAKGIAGLIGNEKAMGEAFHITTDEAIKWDDVLAIYKKTFKDVTGQELKVRYIDDPRPVYEITGSKYQVIYDRIFDRRFNNERLRGAVREFEFAPPESGLEKCLREFLRTPEFRGISPEIQAWMDREAKERTSFMQFQGLKNKVKYGISRYTPYLTLKKAPFVRLRLRPLLSPRKRKS